MLRLSLLILTTSLAVASPVTKRWYPDSLGAHYFITNGFEGNQLVASYIMPGGQLVPGDAICTNGTGSAGINDPAPYENHPDPFYGGGSVVVCGDYVYNVNAGSNTISASCISPDDPGRPVLSATYPSMGDFPVSLAASSDGTMLCVLNGGAMNGFACFSIGDYGCLTHMPSWDRSLGLNLTTPPHGPVGGTASMMAFARDMSTLYVTVKADLAMDLNNPDNTTMPGYVAAYAINNMTLSAEPVKSNAGAPFSIEEDLHMAGQWFMSDPTSGYAFFESNSSGMVDVMQGKVPGEGADCWSAQSNRTGSYFVVDTTGTSVVTEVAVDFSTSNGTILASHHTGTNASATDLSIASLPDYDYMWVLASGYRTIHTYKIVAAGDFSLVQTYDLAQDGVAEMMGLNLTKGFAGSAVYIKNW